MEGFKCWFEKLKFSEKFTKIRPEIFLEDLAECCDLL